MSSVTTILWLDPNISGKSKSYYEELKSLNTYKIRLAKTVEEAMGEIYEMVFEDVFIIVNGSLFPQFYNEFKNNLNKICIVPKIVIFIDNENASQTPLGIDQNIIGDKFYNIGGIKHNFSEVMKFIKDPEMNKYKFLLKSDEEYLNFDYIDTKDKLLLPLFYKFLIKFTERDNNFNNLLYKKYYKKSKEIRYFLDSISNLPDIPIEILSKYYVRIYTDEESRFYSDLNKNLRKGKKEKYLPYIKILYEGIRLKALPYSSEVKLYRGGILPYKEIEKIINYKKKGAIEGLPGAIVFSKTFLSFSKDKEVAEYFIDYYSKNSSKKFGKVLFTLEREINIDYNLSTHVDVGKLSLLPNEREVLFFPFSSFEIKEIKLEKDIYQITLLYLAKYVDKYKKDFINLPQKIPDSIYKKELIESNLIKLQDIESTNSLQLYKKSDNYNIVVKPNPQNPPIRIPTNINPFYNIRSFKSSDKYKNFTIQNSPEKNYITGYFLITNKDLYLDIRIINSFEESKRRYNYIKVQNELKYNNEKEIMNKCEISINGRKIDNFVYFVKFHSPGEYVINYKFKSKLNRADFMFAECTKLKHLDLDNFNSNELTNMSCMFMQCTSLEDLNINKLDTQNVYDISGMFYGCESLNIIDLSKFNTQKVENMSFLFFGCKSLVDVNLSGFNTQNVKDMYCMFSGCSSLSSLYFMNFSTQNVINMTRMFYDCQSLEELNLSSFYTNKVQYMNSMFSGCSSLSKLDISNFNVEKIINMEDMFRGCFSLKLENIDCKIKNILIKRYHFNN